MTEPQVAILVPRRAGIEDRDRLWQFCRAWWAEKFPSWRIVEGHHDTGPFNRSMAINRAAEQAGPWDVAVIIDADVLCDPAAVERAVHMAAEEDRMVVAYDERVMLTDVGTAAVMEGFKGNWRNPAYSGRIHRDACSSCVVVSHRLFDMVHGFDERFVGWGWEDVAFRLACETMSGRTIGQVSATCWHLHHQISPEANLRTATLQANEMRALRYRAAHLDKAALQSLIDEPIDGFSVVDLQPSRIPRILHRTVPAVTSDQVEDWWEGWEALHPGWEMMTHRDPMDPKDWPVLGDLWGSCQNGAQKAGLIRLEALWKWGGVYVDSDVEAYRSLEPLMNLSGFAAWEDDKVIPDAVLGATIAHPAVEVMMMRARAVVEKGGDAWHSGPGVTTRTLSNRSDWLVLPPGSFYPYHYRERHLRHTDHKSTQPWAFGAHHWSGSWLTTAQRAANHLPTPLSRILKVPR